MQEQLEIRNEMATVRNRGLANADKLAERVERLSDWREHVRAHPWPIALAVASLACWAIPSRRSEKVRRSEATTAAGEAALKAYSSVKQDLPTAKEVKTSGLAGLSGAAMGFVGSLIGNAVRSYVSEQVQTLITSRGNHDASQQRQAPYTRY